MKALVLEEKGVLSFQEVKTPVPQEGEALIKVQATGICGSDLPRIFGGQAYFYPLIPGHELAGVVVEVGKKEDKEWIGKRVTAYPLIPCRNCPYCEVGQYELCNNYGYLGSRQNGSFAEFVVAPVENLMSLPQGVSWEEGALSEPGAVTLHALRRAHPEVGDRVAVFGLGPIGLLCGMWAKMGGARMLTGYDVDEQKFPLAHTLGFDLALSPAEKKEEVDLSIEASGNSRALRDALGIVRKKGKLLLVGNQEQDVTLKPEDIGVILRRELTVVGTWNSDFSSLNSDWKRLLELEERGRISLSPLISHRITLEEAPSFMLEMQQKRFSYTKVIIEPQEVQ